MKFSRRKAVSPIIASLLLIAIAVAAGIIVYVYVNSLAGNLTAGGGSQESQQIQLQSYSFSPVGTTSAAGFTYVTTTSTEVLEGTSQTIDVFLENTGSSAVSVNAIYFDGTQLTEWYNTGSPAAYDTYLEVPSASATAVGCFALIPSSTTSQAITSVTTTSSTVVAGAATSNECVGSGSPNAGGFCGNTDSPAFCIKPAGGSGYNYESSSLPAQSTVQLVIGLSSGWTPAIVSGTSHTIKLITATGGQAVFTVVAGRSG